MKKILHITSQLARNGTETFLMNVFRKIDKTIISFDFLVFTDSEDGFYREAESLGATIFRLKPRRNGFLKYNKDLNNFFREHANEYSAVHFSACSLTTVLPLYYAMKYCVPIRIIHSHSSKHLSGLHNYILHKINKRIIPLLCTHYLACSAIAAEWFYSGTDAMKKVSIMNNGIDLSLFEYNKSVRDEVRESLDLDSCFVVGNVSRFSLVKNHLFILEIFKYIKRDCFNAKLLLIGNGELFECVKSRTNELGLNKDVIFLGEVSDVYRMLQAFDCFVFPSLFEGLPFSLVEAQASGLDVFTSTNVSLEVKMTNNVHFLNLSDSPDYWAQQILISGKQFNRRKQNDEIIKSGYSIDDTVEKLIRLYNFNCSV